MEKILLDYINNYEGWVTKGQLYVIGEQEGYSPEYVGRELRLLAQNGKIQVDYYKSKRKIKLARYSRLGEKPPNPPKPQITFKENELGNLVAYIQ